jgi:hypothetical protein
MVIGSANSVEDFINQLPKALSRLHDIVGSARRLFSSAIRELSCREVGEVPLAAIDSAFPQTAIELVGASIAPIAAVAITTRNGVIDRIVEHKLLYSVDETIQPDLVVATARRMERVLALRSLDGVKLLLFDGELLPLTAAADSELVNLSKTVLEQARRKGVTVVGVIKRTRSRILSSRLHVAVSDKALTALMLKPCEALVVEHPSTMLRRLGCVITFYKPLRGIAFSVKAELCGDTSYLDLLASMPGWSGLPWPIDLVDSIAKQEVNRLINLVQTKLRRFMVELDVVELTAPLNPQEAGSQRSQGG